MSQDIGEFPQSVEIDLFELVSVVLDKLVWIAVATALAAAAGFAYGLQKQVTNQAVISFSTNYYSTDSEIRCYGSRNSLLCRTESDLQFLKTYDKLNVDFAQKRAVLTYNDEKELTDLLDLIRAQIASASKRFHEEGLAYTNYLKAIDRGEETVTLILDKKIRANYSIRQFESGVNFAEIEKVVKREIKPNWKRPGLFAGFFALAFAIFGILFWHYYRDWKARQG